MGTLTGSDFAEEMQRILEEKTGLRVHSWSWIFNPTTNEYEVTIINKENNVEKEIYDLFKKEGGTIGWTNADIRKYTGSNTWYDLIESNKIVSYPDTETYSLSLKWLHEKENNVEQLTDEQLARQIRTQVEAFNDLLKQAKERGMVVSVANHYTNDELDSILVTEIYKYI